MSLKNDFMMIKSILSDLGNVLIFVGHANAGLDIPKTNFFNRYIILSKIKSYEKGKLSTEYFYTWYSKKVGKNIDLNHLDDLFGDVFSLNEAMDSLLRKLKRDYRLVAVSNTNEANYDFFSKKYDLSFFDDLVLSHKVGSLKPERSIYEVALEKALCKPEECLFIDDVKKFVDAAKKFGFNAVHYDYRNHYVFEEKLKEFGIQFPKH